MFWSRTTDITKLVFFLYCTT